LHIALLIGSMNLGGAERQFVALANGLVRRGHQVSLVCLVGGGPLETDLSESNLFQYLPIKNGGSGWKAIFAARKQLPKWVRDQRPDILYSALYHANWVAANPRIARQIPVVWGIRSAEYPLPLRAHIAVMLGRRLKRHVTGLISNSQNGIEVHKKLNYLPTEHRVIPNGTDTNRFIPNDVQRLRLRSKLGIEKDAIVLGFVGRPEKVKGFDLLPKIIGELRKREIQNPCIVAVPQIKSLANDLVAKLNVLKVNLVPGKTIEEIYPAMDVLMLPSRAEGFPNAVAEAMACEVLPVTFNVGDCALLVNNETQLVPEGNVLEFSKRLADFLSAPTLISMKKNARKHIIKNFGLDVMVDATELALKSCKKSFADMQHTMIKK